MRRKIGGQKETVSKRFSLQRAAKILILLGIVYGFYALFMLFIQHISVTLLNAVFGVVVLFAAAPLVMLGAMANDSGRGGFKIGLMQVLTLSFFPVYLIALVSSIGILYLPFFEHQEAVALGISSLTGIHILLIAGVFLGVFFTEKFES